jgi:hypothetical protein
LSTAVDCHGYIDAFMRLGDRIYDLTGPNFDSCGWRLGLCSGALFSQNGDRGKEYSSEFSRALDRISSNFIRNLEARGGLIC